MTCRPQNKHPSICFHLQPTEKQPVRTGQTPSNIADFSLAALESFFRSMWKRYCCFNYKSQSPNSHSGEVATYQVTVLQDLAGREVFVLGGFVGILVVHFIQAGRTSCKLELPEKLHITLIQTLQRTPAHSPVEIVHTLALKSHVSWFFMPESSCTHPFTYSISPSLEVSPFIMNSQTLIHFGTKHIVNMT